MKAPSFKKYEIHGKIDFVISNAGYGLFGAAEEFSNEQINHITAANLTGSIQFIKSSLPYTRRQGGGRIIHIFSYGGRTAYAADSMYHTTKFGIEDFCESVAKEVAKYNTGVTIVESGGARSEFRYGSAKVDEGLFLFRGEKGLVNKKDKQKFPIHIKK